MDLNMNCGLSREAKEQAISIARNQLPPPSENRSNTNMDTIYPSVSKWTEYIDEDGSNVNEATVLPDQELDKHNRVVFGRVEQKQPAKKKSKLAEVSNRPHVRPKAAQQARYSPYNIDRSSNAASGSASKDTQKLSDALMSLTQKANRTNPTPVSKNVTIHTHEKPLKLPVKQQQTSSKWQEFDNDSSSEDEID
ncbi:hypothetical protein GGI05_001877 [Coemansia sp. RSA 2603]|nr:hypothetical protein GGI05_001877 [Coemansia sp. RSA 2603]